MTDKQGWQIDQYCKKIDSWFELGFGFRAGVVNIERILNGMFFYKILDNVTNFHIRHPYFQARPPCRK